MADPELRARLMRFVRGDFRTDDLDKIFLYARLRSNGSEAVKDVGDFVAHKTLRDEGPVTRSTRDWYITAGYYFRIKQGAVNPDNLPPDFPEFLHSALYRATNQLIKKQAGLTHWAARKILPGLIEKLRNDNGSLSIKSGTLSLEERRLFRFLADDLPADAPAFTNDRLFADLTTILKREGLLLREEQKKFGELKTLIGLYAVSAMHDSVMDIGNGSKIPLTAAPNALSVGDLGVMAPVPIQLPQIQAPLPPLVAGALLPIPGHPGYIAMLSRAMFSTGIESAAHCSPELLDSPRSWAGVPIEIGADLRLTIIR